MLLSAASKLHHNALWTQSPSPAPFEPAVQVRSPDSRLDSFHMAKLELEASAMENHRASSLVTRAALKDAMRVLDENRALKQLQAQTEGRLMVSAVHPTSKPMKCGANNTVGVASDKAATSPDSFTRL
jgi:hypothetical protein